jgi:type VI secretion system ImpM family protein
VPSVDGKVGCYGKLPIAGDFVRGSEGLPELEQMDAWVQDGMHRSHALLGSGWQDRFDALGDLHFFLAPDRSGTRVVGRLQASRDAAGRRYPFVVAARVPAGVADRDSHLLLALTRFLADAGDLARQGFPGHSVLEVIAAVRSLACHPDSSAAKQVFVREARDTAPEMLLQGAGEDASLLLEQLAGFAISPPRYCLRWGSRTESCDLAFWLDLLAGFQGQGGTLAGPYLCMWPAQGVGVVRFAFGPLDAKLFPGMIFPDLDDDHAYDLGRDHGDASVVEAARARFADSLRSPDLAGVLAAAVKMGRR